LSEEEGETPSSGSLEEESSEAETVIATDCPDKSLKQQTEQTKNTDQGNRNKDT
jgi:hypothetical protein